MNIMILSQMLTEGGAERVASLWISGFCAEGHCVSVVMNTNRINPITYSIPENVRIFNLCKKKGVATRVLKKIGIELKPIKKLRKIILETKPDVIIGLLHPYASWALEASRGLNIPIINTEHNCFERPAYAPLDKKTIRNKFESNKLFNHVTVLTKRDYDLLKDKLNNVSVLPNPLSFDPYYGENLRKNVILVSARLSVWHCKGLDLLIKAWGKISKKFPDWKIEIAGRNDDKSLVLLQSMAEDCGVDDSQLSFCGFCRDILPLYRQAKIFVMSSRYEGFGMSLIEAMSQGCACITCDFLGRQREIIQDDSQGIVCPIDDVDALAKALEKMISDDAYRMMCAKNAIERSKYYSLSNIMEKWNQIFKDLNLTE